MAQTCTIMQQWIDISGVEVFRVGFIGWRVSHYLDLFGESENWLANLMSVYCLHMGIHPMQKKALHK